MLKDIQERLETMLNEVKAAQKAPLVPPSDLAAACATLREHFTHPQLTMELDCSRAGDWKITWNARGDDYKSHEAPTLTGAIEAAIRTAKGAQPIADATAALESVGPNAAVHAGF